RREPKERPASATEFLTRLRIHLSGSAKRKESRAISERIAETIAQEREDYVTLTQLLDRIEQARLLWPGNEQAAQPREELLSRQARIAIREGDLLLARVTIERLSHPESRDALRMELEHATAARTRREKERRVLRWSTAALLGVVTIGSALFSLELTQQ